MNRFHLHSIHHRLLFVIACAGRFSVGEIADRLAVSRQAIHGPMRPLRSGGQCGRQRDEQRRSVQIVRLTGAGSQLERKLTGIQRRHLAAAFADTSDGAAQGWRRVMREIAAHLPPASQQPSRAPALRRQRP